MLLSDFEKVISFAIELEKLKGVARMIRPVGADRYETAAEHSWQVALLALSLAPYAAHPVEAAKVVRMLLIHDVVEIDAGDKIVYSDAHSDFKNEHAAAIRIFGLLPPELGEAFLALWEEFEEGETPEANFARAVDRLMPVLQNLHNCGQSWVENRISLAQVMEKNHIISHIHPDLWRWVEERINAAAEQGYLQ